jgi:CelD/BcsL family acetyltransferase involved in cellulose biosynthesis
MMDVVEINCLEDLQPYRLHWRSLLSETREASFFQSWDWLQAFWRHFGDGHRLRVLLVTSQGSLLGVLPLMVARERTRLGTLRVLTYPLRDWSTFYAPIGPNPTATLTAGLRYVRAAPRDWDLLDLRWTNKQIDCGRSPAAMEFAGFSPRSQIWKTSHFIDMDTSWQAYWASRSNKLRNNVHRNGHRADQLGTVVYERFRPPGTAFGDGQPGWELFEECLELAARSWQGSSASGTTLSHPEVREFFREAHEAAARAGAVDINLLRISGRLIAFNYNYVFAGRIQGLRMGYDPDFRFVGPGMLLLARTLQDSFLRGDRQLDLGVDPAGYKRVWCTRTLNSYRYTHYASSSPRSQLLRWKHHFWPSEVEPCSTVP